MSHKIDSGLPVARPPEAVNASATVRAGGERSQPVAAIAPADSIRLTGEAEGLQALERQLGAAPAGIDVARVNELRAAIADGSYRVDAQQVADRMLALDSALNR
ncbi:MAG TPA: flagellar biosynthesis anti-sigma factor FlgM [Lysobacter sp.]